MLDDLFTTFVRGTIFQPTLDEICSAGCQANLPGVGKENVDFSVFSDIFWERMKRHRDTSQKVVQGRVL